MKFKLGIDGMMTMLLIIAMSSTITGITWHIIIGISLCMLIIVHNILNRRWYKSIHKGKHTAFRNLSTGVNMLFLAAMTVLFVSAAFISLGGSFFMRQIHVLSAYWGFILMSVHIGMHGRMIVLIAGKTFGRIDSSRICTITMRSIALCIAAYGVMSSFDRNMGSKLIMYYSFDTINADESALSILAAYLSIMGVYIIGTYYVLMLIRTVTRSNLSKYFLRVIEK